MAIKKRPEETIDSMLKRFKKEMLKSELMKDIRKREYYVSPGEKKRIKAKEAQKKFNKKNAVKPKLY